MPRRFPHPRGGEPPRYRPWGSKVSVFPTRVGVNRNTAKRVALRKVFPTRVGVNRNPTRDAIAKKRFPHPRGGEPLRGPAAMHLEAFSPPAWG